MMENSHRRIVTIATSSVIVLFGIICAIPFNTVSYETMETYYETGVKQEPYIAKESYIVQELIDLKMIKPIDSTQQRNIVYEACEVLEVVLT